MLVSAIDPPQFQRNLFLFSLLSYRHFSSETKNEPLIPVDRSCQACRRHSIDSSIAVMFALLLALRFLVSNIKKWIFDAGTGSKSTGPSRIKGVALKGEGGEEDVVIKEKQEEQDAVRRPLGILLQNVS